jgi:prepilin-type N-terminal cleavage/methylation domain-containing protein/prepilin-type processing-associated H-X9-DG protein
MTKRRAFTLVELLATIAIIGLLVGLLMPAVQSARESSRRISCVNNLKQWALGMHLHHESQGFFPYFGQRRNNPEVNTQVGVAHRRMWVQSLWPFVEQVTLSNQWNMNDNYYGTAPANAGGPANRELIKVKLPMYFCPSDLPGSVYGVPGGLMAPWGEGSSRGNYAVNMGPTRAYVSSGPRGPFGIKNLAGGGTYVPFRTQFAHLKDGSSNTFLMSELRCAPNESDDARGGLFIEPNGGWFTAAAPPNSGIDRWSANVIKNNENSIFPAVYTADSSDQWQYVVRSQHPGGANAVFCDGSVAFMPDAIDLGVWQELSTRNSGNAAGPW